MVKKDKNQQNYVKIVNERYTLPSKRGGEISPIDDFVSYEKLIERFENDIKEFIK